MSLKFCSSECNAQGITITIKKLLGDPQKSPALRRGQPAVGGQSEQELDKTDPEVPSNPNHSTILGHL